MLADKAKIAIEQAERAYCVSDSFHVATAISNTDSQALIEDADDREGLAIVFSDDSAILVRSLDDQGYPDLEVFPSKEALGELTDPMPVEAILAFTADTNSEEVA